MKNYKKILCFFLVLLCSIFLISCVKEENKKIQLNAPIVLSVSSNNIIRWSNVSNADKYVISINEIEDITFDLSYDLAIILEEKQTAEIKILAKSNGIFLDSEWSETFIHLYQPASEKEEDIKPNILKTPVIERIEKSIIHWSIIENADRYVLEVNDQIINTLGLSYDISSVFTSSVNNCYARVKALSAEGSAYIDSSWSILFCFDYDKKNEDSTENVNIEHFLHKQVVKPQEEYISAIYGKDFSSYRVLYKIGTIYNQFIQPLTDAVYWDGIDDRDSFTFTKTNVTESSITNGVEASTAVSRSIEWGVGLDITIGKDSWPVKGNISGHFSKTDSTIDTTAYIDSKTVSDSFSSGFSTTKYFNKKYPVGYYIFGAYANVDYFIELTVDSEQNKVIDVSPYYGIKEENFNLNKIKFVSLDDSNITIDDFLKIKVKIGDSLNSIISKNPNGEGTVNNPYLVSNYTQFIQISLEPDKHYKLINDIDLSEYKQAKSPIDNTFTGVLDGNSHIIKNLHMNLTLRNTTSSNIGLFSNIAGSVRNLKLQNFDINFDTDHAGNTFYYVGLLTGSGNGVIENVTINNGPEVYNNLSIHRYQSSYGAIAGIFYGTITNCKVNHTNIMGNGDTGGIVGTLVGTLKDTHISNSLIWYYNVKNSQSIGALTGYCNGGKIENCSSSRNTFEYYNTPYHKNFWGTKKNDNNPKIGNLVGHINNGKLLNCTADSNKAIFKEGYKGSNYFTVKYKDFSYAGMQTGNKEIKFNF